MNPPPQFITESLSLFFVPSLFLEGIAGCLGCLVGQAPELAGDLVHRTVDVGLVLQEEGPDDAVVHHIRAVVGGGHVAPHEEAALGEPVEGHPREEDVREELNHGEHGKHNPVGEPAGVVFSAHGFESLQPNNAF